MGERAGPGRRGFRLVPRPGRIAARWRLSPSALPSARDERHATWLELFFDLVFALALATVQNRLHHGPSPGPDELLQTLGLFALVWWAWAGQAFYDTRFDPDDRTHRLALPVETRPVLWLAGMAIEILTPWVGRSRLVRLPVHPSHLPERLGQFTIILLGVSLADLLEAVPARPSVEVVAAAAVAFVVPASMWWVYTTFVTTGLAIRRLTAGLGYAYLRGAIGAALLLLAWALGQTVRLVGEGSAELPGTLRLLLAVSIGTWMFGGMVLQWASLGHLIRRRVGIAAAGTGPVAVIAAVAPEPMTTLLLLAAVLVGCAVANSRQIVRAGGDTAEGDGGPAESG